jgi:hypothetical protein
MQLVNEGGTWRVTGQDSDGARVAYARLQDGSVTYSFDGSPAAH